MRRLRPTLFLALVALGCDSTVPPPHEASGTPQQQPRAAALHVPPSPEEPALQASAPAAARSQSAARHAHPPLEPLREAPATEPQIPLDPLARAAAEREAKRHIGTVPPPAEPPINPADLPPPPAAPSPPPPTPGFPPPPDQTSHTTPQLEAPPVATSPAPTPPPTVDAPSVTPRDNGPHQLARIAADKLCVTRGTLAKTHVAVPTFRAVAPGNAGDSASLRVVVHGTSKNERALASGQHRRQVGLKLRAANGCNLVYVMWRLDPKPQLEVSVKANPGMRTSQECGANGYTKVKASRTAKLPSLIDDQEHELRASIDGNRLVATVDGTTVWQGTLPAAAANLVGPAGVRSDNLDLDIVSFAADSRTQSVAKLDCKGGGDEESD